LYHLYLDAYLSKFSDTLAKRVTLQYTSSLVRKAYCSTAMQNSMFYSLAITIISTYCAYPRKDTMNRNFTDIILVYRTDETEILSKTSCRRAAATISPPRPATEARTGSLEPGRPSRARSANTCHAAGWPHTPPADRMYATDIRQRDVRQHHRLMPPGRGIINYKEIRPVREIRRIVIESVKAAKW